MLSKLRNTLKSSGLQAYLIPSGDAHQSEYIAACDARRGFISGFTGSAGYAIVTLDKAALWTDGRYFLQAEQQLSKEWTLMRDGQPETPTRINWLKQVLTEGSSIGYDPQMISITEFRDLQKSLKKFSLVSCADNLVDRIWDQRPARPANPLLVLDMKFTGRSHVDKIKNLQEYLASFKSGVASLEENTNGGGLKASGFLATALDEVCWTLNLRGSDITFNPVFFSYLLVTPTSSILFTDPSRVDVKVKEHLSRSNTQLAPYSSLATELKKFTDQHLNAADGNNNKLLVGDSASVFIAETVGHDKVEVVKSPIRNAKAIKTKEELDGFRNCHLRDASALCRFFGWLENELVVKGNRGISEVDAADKLESFRSQLGDFMGLSFDTISSTGANGAIIHYKPLKDKCAKIDKDQVYLCDSGGQYLDGTTDVTRTFHFGKPTEFERLAFTRVLQGHIALDQLVFTEGTTGYQIDAFARAPLWKSGLNYRHGTGHGVGSFLNVHEGPHGISYRRGHDEYELLPSMTVTNEPGYYHDGKFGIRIENILIVNEANTPHKFADKKYLGFEYVTLVPIGLNLIDRSLLSPSEVQWLNVYHQKCREKIGPLVKDDDLAYKWLMKETEQL